MTNERFLLDTVFIQGLLNRHDQYHAQAKLFLPRLKTALEVWITEAVLVEVANALSGFNRIATAQFIEQCYKTPNIRVVTVDTPLMTRALQLYQSRLDKAWSLTDCISFVVMQEQNLTDAVTTDKHFVQAGYRLVL